MQMFVNWSQNKSQYIEQSYGTLAVTTNSRNSVGRRSANYCIYDLTNIQIYGKPAYMRLMEKCKNAILQYQK